MSPAHMPRTFGHVLRLMTCVVVAWSTCGDSALAQPRARSPSERLYWEPIDGDLHCVTVGGSSRICEADGGAVSLGPGERVFLSASRGRAVRGVTEPRAEIHLGMGYGATPVGATVVWETTARRQGQLRVPAFGSARFLVLSLPDGGEVQLSVLRIRERPLASRAFEQAIGAFTRGEAERPRAPDASADRSLRMARDIREALPGVDSDRLAQLVESETRALHARSHPMRPPFFAKVEEDQATLRIGATHSFAAALADVWSLGIRARPGERSRAEIRTGDALVAVVEWSGLERAGVDGWTDARRMVRVVPGISRQFIQVVAVSGELSIEARGYRRRPRLRELSWASGPTSTAGSSPSDAALALVAALRRRPATARARASRWIQDVDNPRSARALVAWSLARASPTVEQASRSAKVALDLGGLGPTLRALLFDHILTLSGALDPEHCQERVLEGTTDPDLVAALAMGAVLCPAGSAQAPTGTAALESLARARPDDLWLREVARRAVRREVSWRLATHDDAPRQSTSLLPDDGRSDATCSSSGRFGMRWTVLGPGRHRVMLESTDVRARVLRLEDGWEGNIHIAGVPIPVHGAAGLVSRVSVTEGERLIEVPRDAPRLLVRLPRTDRLPCEELRDVRRWPVLSTALTFSLPAHGTALNRARVSLGTTDNGSLPRRLRVIAGDDEVFVDVPGGGSASFEVPVRARAERLSVLPDAPASGVLVHVRLPHSRPRGDDRRRLERPVEAVQGAEATAAALEVIRASSRSLSSHPGWRARFALHAQRGRALESLGYQRLAQLDHRFTGLSPRRHLRDSDAVVVPRNLAARVPPLRPLDHGRLRLARELSARGAHSHARELVDHAERGSAEALLAALIDESQGERLQAARTWELTGTAEGLARAARLRADEGAETGDPDAAVDSLVLAIRAAQAGADPSGTMARVSRSVRWERPQAVDEAAGVRTLLRDPTEGDSMGSRVRRAWLDAPDDAILIREDQWLRTTLRVREPTELVVDGRCSSVAGDEGCTWQLAVDGQALEQSQEATRRVVLSPGSHQVSIRSDRPALGWLRLRTAGGTEQLDPRTASLWYEAAPRRRVRFAAVGPTVLRVTTRSGGSSTGRAAGAVLVDGVEVQQVPAGGGEEEGFVEIPIEAPGTHEVIIRSPAGRLLVRPTVAVPHEAPRQLIARATPRPRPTVAGSTIPPYEAQQLEPGEPRRPGPFSGSVRARYVFHEIRDLDTRAEGAPYLEVSPGLHASLADIGHLNFSLLGRVRGGPPSYGGRGRLELAGAGLRPRVSLFGELMAQPLEGRLVWAAEGRISTVWTVPVHPLLSIHPLGTLRLAHVGEAPPGIDGIDPDVYTNFARRHPQTLRLGLALYSRPFVDLFLRAGFYTLTNDDLVSADRMDARVSVDAAPGGKYLPLLGLGYRFSYRFADPFRPTPIVRHVVEGRADAFQTWFGDSRMALGAQVEWVVDRSELAAFVMLEYLWSPGRGLRDFTSQEARFPEGLEEGANVSELLGRPAEATEVTFDGAE